MINNHLPTVDKDIVSPDLALPIEINRSEVEVHPNSSSSNPKKNKEKLLQSGELQKTLLLAAVANFFN